MYTSHYIIIFVVFSVIGWIVDTSYRSIGRKTYSPGTKYFFDPVYGFGAVALSLFYSHAHIHVLLKIILAGLLLSLVELIAGILILFVLKKRIWDYRNNKCNIGGHIDVLHSFYWILLAGVYYHLGHYFSLFSMEPLM